VKIRFYGEDGNKVFRETVFSHENFLTMIPSRADFDNLGFAYFVPDKEVLEGTTSLELCSSCNSVIGKEALTISYQYDQNNMALRSAMVSSNYITDRGLTYIQFDGIVRPGTSGSPLLEIESGKVIGILISKELQIVKTYREILKNVDNNLAILEKVTGKWFIEDVDPIQVLIVNQYQIKHLTKEFFSNFAIKAGYALDVNHLREQLEGYSEIDLDREKPED
ncbi:MAG: trypsin-like peptidase domain-containing protein, partial [Bacteroidales bacterium]|nr:trypsin-like peptidase domain-containing protein [Bacteroidales bacterium]